jgi:hypothetical protein
LEGHRRAPAPLLLAAIIPLVARAGPEIPVPFLSRVIYTVDELVLLIILLLGTAVGAKRRFPSWSYTWVVLTVASIVTFFTALLPTLLLGVVDYGVVTLGLLFTLIPLLGGLLVLAFAASRATRGIIHAFFVAAIYLVSIALRLYIQEVSTSVSPAEVVTANAISIIITTIELVVVVAAVMHFLAGDAKTQQRSLYVLIAVALLDPILTGWVLVLNFSEPTFTNVGGFLGLQILVRWGYAGVALLITWALTILFTTWQQARVSNQGLSGEVDG